MSPRGRVAQEGAREHLPWGENEGARVAVYYAPAATDPLWDAAAHWLGRDPDTNAPCQQPPVPSIGELTAEARRYGFHATLKPPLRLRPGVGWKAFRDAAHRLAGTIAPFTLPKLRIGQPHGFLALQEAEACPPLQALADACVAGLDEFRAPPEAAELARRRRGVLPTEQEAMLQRWGYPYAFATWFFHMTLSRRLAPDEREGLHAAAAAHFAGLLDTPRQVREICLFTEAAPGAPFLLAERLELRG